MRVFCTSAPSTETGADTIVVGLFAPGRESAAEPQASGGGAAQRQGVPSVAGRLPDALGALIDSGEARASFKSLALGHADGVRWLLIGLGERDRFTPERARVAAAVARERACELGMSSLCWQAPDGGPAVAAALVEGTVLADYRFERFRSIPQQPDAKAPPKHLEELTIAGSGELEEAVSAALVVAEAVNAARDLQNRPGNDLTPTALGERARELADADERLSVEVEGGEGLASRSMGAFAAVAQGSAQEPALITMRYEPPSGAAAGAPVLGIVGKAVTFDSGGLSLKPAAKMSEMKFDMSGGAAALLATVAIAKLRLPLRVVTVIGATENVPSGRSVKPGDIVTACNGRTIEINNTDAEGRLVLADCLCHAVSEGAERIVDLATLTGAVLVALGSTHAGLVANDDELAARVERAGAASGEIVWRLPMHEEYDELIKGAYADLDNAPEGRKAGTIVGGAFLSNFVGEVPWAHLDIAGTAWDLGRAYAKKQGSGFGVRLLVELARSYCA
ncbi:MAG: leucyl aminopeptidase family protein [Solirubrobacteraceae bacterium]